MVRFIFNFILEYLKCVAIRCFEDSKLASSEKKFWGWNVTKIENFNLINVPKKNSEIKRNPFISETRRLFQQSRFLLNEM